MPSSIGQDAGPVKPYALSTAILILNFRRSRVAGLQQWMLRYPTFPHRKRRRVYDERVGF
jgi:hypothetical protein